MYSKEEAHLQIAALVERFTEQLPSYKKSDYNETLTRKDFIDPFFKALGWDMNNSAGNAEAYREVIHEDKIKIGATHRTKPTHYSTFAFAPTAQRQFSKAIKTDNECKRNRVL